MESLSDARKLAGGGAHGLRRREAEAHGAGLGLMGEPERFQRDREAQFAGGVGGVVRVFHAVPRRDGNAVPGQQRLRSEERRGGKEGVSTGRSRWSPYH